MRKLKLFTAITLAVLGMLFVLNYGTVGEISRGILGMKSSVLYKTSAGSDDTAESFPPEALTAEETMPVQSTPPAGSDIVPTTIAGGLSIKNSTSYIINVKEIDHDQNFICMPRQYL